MTTMQIFDSSQSATQTNSNDEFQTSSKKWIIQRSSTMTVLLALSTFIFFISTIILSILLGLKYVESDLASSNQQIVELSGNKSTTNQSTKARSIEWPKASGTLYAKFKRAAITTDNGLCSDIGRDIYLKGGNAIDATIASLLCVGVVNPQSSGLGGGFVMTIYNSTTRQCITVDAREMAPASSNETMFVDSPGDALVGYRSIAVPSELHGLWTTFTKFGSGRVPWQQLFQPSISIALNGFPVSAHLAMHLSALRQNITNNPSIRKAFTNPETDRLFVEGEIMKREHLGATLQLISNSTDPLKLFYDGGLAQTIAAEIKEHGGYVSLEDLRNYQTRIDEEPFINDHLLDVYAICGPPPPSSFVITQSIIATIAEFYVNRDDADLNDPLFYHRLIEAEKFAYAQRTKLGDGAFVQESDELALNMTKKEYVEWIKSLITNKAQPYEHYRGTKEAQPEDHGTSQVSAIDRNFNAVSCTSTVNQILGSRRISPTLGIVWNDEMDDFSIPGQVNDFGYMPSPSNYVQPGKRPMSSMSPLIVFNKETGRVKMVIGASGGSMIISATAQAVIRALIFNQTIKEAIDAPRIHNQFTPLNTVYESSIPEVIITDLRQKHNQNMTSRGQLACVVQGVMIGEDGYIYANNDYRRAIVTSPAGF